MHRRREAPQRCGVVREPSARSAVAASVCHSPGRGRLYVIPPGAGVCKAVAPGAVGNPVIPRARGVAFSEASSASCMRACMRAFPTMPWTLRGHPRNAGPRTRCSFPPARRTGKSLFSAWITFAKGSISTAHPANSARHPGQFPFGNLPLNPGFDISPKSIRRKSGKEKTPFHFRVPDASGAPCTAAFRRRSGAATASHGVPGRLCDAAPRPVHPFPQTPYAGYPAPLGQDLQFPSPRCPHGKQKCRKRRATPEPFRHQAASRVATPVEHRQGRPSLASARYRSA